MRIGVDAHLVRSKPTGVGKSIVRIIEAMADAASCDEVVAYANREFPDVLNGRANCRVVRTPLIALSRGFRILHERFLMPRRLRRDRIDVFFAPGFVFPGEPPVPMVLGIFDLHALKHPKRVRSETAWYYKWAMPLSASNAALIVTPTRAVAGDVERILKIPRDKIRVVPLAADDRFRRPSTGQAEVAAKHAIDAPYVLFVGNIEPNKNLGRLVEAFFAAKLHRRLPHKLVIAGKKRDRAADLANAVRRLGCAEHVVFTGYVDDADLPALYAGADAFVYPSHAEGFGIPPLEAMSCGTPVIASADAAVVEVTGNAALHFPADDIAALREAMEKVLTDDAFAADLVRRGRAAADRYSWAATGRKTLDVLREAAGGAK